MRRLFFTILLWFWLTLTCAAVLFLAVIVHSGTSSKLIVRLVFHDLALFSIAGAIFCFFLSRYLTRPLSNLAGAAARIADGRLDTRVDPALKRRGDEIAQLARNFDRMAERIEALVTGQRRLLGDVSHELRSPLARLMVALTMVKQGPAEEVPDHLERIGLESRRLDALIGQLLALTRIDSGVDRASPAPVDFTRLVQEVVNDGDFEARGRNRRVVAGDTPVCAISGFEELLRSALENVIRNAIRHTAEGTAVEIRLFVKNGRAVLRIRDHGPGVPEHMLSEIFQPFRRAHEGDSDGAGLGLAIAQRAVQVHSGTLRAMNAPDGGLEVEIDLPAPAPLKNRDQSALQ